MDGPNVGGGFIALHGGRSQLSAAVLQPRDWGTGSGRGLLEIVGRAFGSVRPRSHARGRTRGPNSTGRDAGRRISRSANSAKRPTPGRARASVTPAAVNKALEAERRAGSTIPDRTRPGENWETLSRPGVLSRDRPPCPGYRGRSNGRGGIQEAQGKKNALMDWIQPNAVHVASRCSGFDFRIQVPSAIVQPAR